MRRRLATLLMITVAGLGLGGCGESATSQVRDKVQELAQATAARDYTMICRQVLAPSLVARLTATGVSCQEALRLALGRVQHPVVSIGKVVVRGDRATAITLTSAQGQQALLAAIALRLTSQGWRIVALNSPISAAAGR